MASWLDELVIQHQELESPLSFWRWSGIAAISAVVKDQVWMNRQIYNLYPNIYVMLHAESGLKKGPPISMAKQLVKAVNNTKIISGRSSIQGILKDMGTAQTMPGGKIENKSTIFVASSELSSSIVDDPVASKILTDLYDRQYNVGEWRSLLKMETFSLKDPTITMLTATNEAMAEGFFDKSAMQGGYFARTFIILETKRNKINSLTYPLVNPPDYLKLSLYLKEVAKLQGPFQPFASEKESDIFHMHRKIDGRDIYFTQTGAIYEDWYHEFTATVDSLESKDETGTLNRFGDSVVKVAMLLALAREPKLVIDPLSMQEAIGICEKLVGNIRKTTLGKKGISLSSTLKSMIINELLARDNHMVTRAVLMKKMWMHYAESSEFDEVMLSFDQSGMIKTTSVGNNIIYTMPPAQAIELKQFFEGKVLKS